MGVSAVSERGRAQGREFEEVAVLSECSLQTKRHAGLQGRVAFSLATSLAPSYGGGNQFKELKSRVGSPS